NAMLLLSRLYSYSSAKFYTFLESILPENASVELLFNLQEKGNGSVPDATISQASFKVVVETKLYGNFELGQLMHHLQTFKGQDYKVLLTLDPNPMNAMLKEKLQKEIASYNSTNQSNVVHRHLTFEELVNGINEIIDDHDYDMLDVLDDYREYCYSSDLIPNDWKRMRVQLAGTTLDINKKLNLYYDNAEHGFSGHRFLGLYKQKAVRAIGKIIAIASAIPVGGTLEVNVEQGELTEEMQERIRTAIDDSKNYGYNLVSIKHRYFFVEQFYETFFEKTTLYAPRGSRMFDLCDVLGVAELPQTDKLAEMLKLKTWQ
ncbi:MAG: hypothetical protein J7559_05095, partial [Cohnella sp.]|nr:hypothetical protein [Cohnella sp.]